MARIDRLTGATFTNPALGAITPMITEDLLLSLRFPADAPFMIFGTPTLTPSGTPTYDSNAATVGVGGANFFKTNIGPLEEGTILTSFSIPAHDGSGTDYIFPWGQVEDPYVAGKEGMNGAVLRTATGASVGIAARDSENNFSLLYDIERPWTANQQHLVAWRWDATGLYRITSPGLSLAATVQRDGLAADLGPLTIGATLGSLGFTTEVKDHVTAEFDVWERALTDTELAQQAAWSVAALDRLGITTTW